jgi:hypothetical protein
MRDRSRRRRRWRRRRRSHRPVGLVGEGDRGPDDDERDGDRESDRDLGPVGESASCGGRPDHQAEDERGSDHGDSHRRGERDDEQKAELDEKRGHSSGLGAVREDRGQQQRPIQQGEGKQAGGGEDDRGRQAVGADSEHLPEQQRIDLGGVLDAEAELPVEAKRDQVAAAQRHVRIEQELLRDVTDIRPRSGAAPDPHLPEERRLETQDHAEQSGLAGAVRADQAGELAGAQREADMIEHRSSAQAYGDPSTLSASGANGAVTSVSVLTATSRSRSRWPRRAAAPAPRPASTTGSRRPERASFRTPPPPVSRPAWPWPGTTR